MRMILTTHKKIIFLFILQPILQSFLLSKEIILDKIIARVNGRNILKTQLEESRISKMNQTYSIQELITEEIIVQKTEEIGLSPSPADLEATFNSEKIATGGNAMSDEAFESVKLRDIGLSLKQYKNQLYRYLAREYLFGAIIAKKMVIPSQDIEDYYRKNPSYTEAQYHILTAASPEQKNTPKAEIAWRDLGWFAQSEISTEFQSVLKNLKPGQSTQEPVSINGRKQLIKLLDFKPKQLEPLGIRYNDIKNKLRDERREPFVKNFVDEIQNRARVIFP